MSTRGEGKILAYPTRLMSCTNGEELRGTETTFMGGTRTTSNIQGRGEHEDFRDRLATHLSLRISVYR